MRVYLASSFDLKGEVEALSKALKARGIETTVEWWHRDSKTEMHPELDDDGWYALKDIKAICKRNLDGIDSADALVLLGPREGVQGFAGANIETGYALAKGKRVLSLGNIPRSAMYSGVVRCKTFEELLERLENH